MQHTTILVPPAMATKLTFSSHGSHLSFPTPSSRSQRYPWERDRGKEKAAAPTLHSAPGQRQCMSYGGIPVVRKYIENCL